MKVSRSIFQYSFCALSCGLFFILVTCTTSPAQAQSITYSAVQPASSNLAASVTFTTLNSTQLQVTLTDTYTGDTPDQSHVLTGVFFSGATGLTPVSATAGAGSVEWEGTTSYAVGSAPGSAALGTEWAYASGSGAPNGAASGIVSSGYWSAAGHGNFAASGDSLDGSAYGLLSAGYAGSDLDGLSSRIYIQDSMVFVLSGFTGNLANISDVSFQYGTTFGSEPNMTGTLQITPVPEPSVMAESAITATLFVSWARFRQNKARTQTMA